MNILALDVGTRRTGSALADDSNGVVVALDTITHGSVDELIEHVGKLIAERSIDHLVLGLPLLPGGTEGTQANFVRSVGQKLQKFDKVLEYIDERYSTPSGRLIEDQEIDRDSASACQILHTYLDRKSVFDNN